MKRAFDLLGAATGLLLLAPVFALLALLVRLTSGGPVLFRQERVGLGGKLFQVWKFRTFPHDGAGTAPTAAGRLLRGWGLDELPQLWNVLRGEMSLVGPRPLVPGEIGGTRALRSRRHEIRPGLTGWAQIHGRKGVAPLHRLALDLWYLEHRSTTLDVAILLRTLPALWQGEGAPAASAAQASAPSALASRVGRAA